MITAVDTNILLDILRPNPGLADSSQAALQEATDDGALVICDIVYAELCCHFESHALCDKFLDAADIRIERVERDATYLASRIWRDYRKRGGQRTRILPDFLIGAHAQIQANRLLTRDRGFYRRLFHSLRLLEPR